MSHEQLRQVIICDETLDAKEIAEMYNLSLSEVEDVMDDIRR